MLAKLLIDTAARAFARRTGRGHSLRFDTRGQSLLNHPMARQAFARGSIRTRSSDRASSVHLMQGEVVQLDAIGYSEEELIAREIKTHREAIALYEDKAVGSDAQLRIFARQILPQLQQHLAMLETLKADVPLGPRP